MLTSEAAPPRAMPDRVSGETLHGVENIGHQQSPVDIEAISYTRVDGTVEVASSPEDAMRRCPVLGKMSVEQANVLLELASIGQEKIDAQKKPKEEFKQKPEEHKETKKPIVEQVIKEDTKTIAQSEVKETVTVTTKSLHEEMIQPQSELDKTIDAHSAKIATEPKVARVTSSDEAIQAQKLVDSPYIEQQVRDKLAGRQNIKDESSDKATNISLRIPPIEEIVITNRLDRQPTAPDAPRAEIVIDNRIMDTTVASKETTEENQEEPFLATSQDSLDDDTFIFTDTELAQEMPELFIAERDWDITDPAILPPFDPVAETLDASESIDLLPEQVAIDAETTELFEQLLAMSVEADEETTSTFVKLVGEQSEAQVPKEVTVEVTSDVNVFADFLDIQPESEETIDIETIVTNANEQPLEETFAQLIELLEGGSFDSTDVMSAIKDFSKAFAYSNREHSTEREELLVTPAITQKLLDLLRAIGYENPQEALLGLISRHDLEFLVQAMRYLAQLANPDNQHEFLRSNPVSHTFKYVIEPAATRLGRSILLLIKQQNLAYE